MQGNSLCKCSLKSLKSLSFVFYFLQAKSEFSSTEEIVQTIQTMTANLAKVSNLYPIIQSASTQQKRMVFIQKIILFLTFSSCGTTTLLVVVINSLTFLINLHCKFSG